MLNMREKIAILLLKSAAKRHLRTARHLRWLMNGINNEWGTPDKIAKEKELLRSDAEKHENAARRIERIIHIYYASKSI